MSTPSGRLRNLTVVLASVVVCGYVLLLLATTWLAQQQLRTEAQEQVQLSLEKRAAALGYFYSERRHDLSDLSRSPSLHNYFINRDLGMSMAYGLRASLLQMEQALDTLRTSRRIAGDPVYTALAVYDDSGTLLAHAPSRSGAAPAPWSGPEGAEAVQISVAGGPDSPRVRMHTGVGHKSGHPGTLVAWIDHARAYQGLIAAEGSPGPARFLVGYGDSVLNAESRAPAGGPGSPGERGNRSLHAGAFPGADGALSARTPVPETPFWLMGVYPASAALGALASKGFFAALIALAVAVLGGAAYLLKVSAHNLMLRARVEESRRQERVLSRQNIRLESEIGRRKDYEQRLVHQANYDQLTGLPNRVLALDRLSQAIERARRDATQILVVFADLDRFKRINDTLGHTTGDRLLVSVGERLCETVRGTDTVARLGGDEFLLICPAIKRLRSAEIIAENLLRTFSRPFALEGKELFVSTSLGLALFPQDGSEALALMKNADLALYRAKDAGRHTFRFFTSSMNEEMQERLAIEGELRRAIERDELTLLYQPVVSLRTGTIVGTEALLRWQSSSLGAVAPDRFIPVAEESGFIEELGEWILRRACRDLAGWQELARVRTAVNISARQLRSNERFLSSVKEALAESGLDPALLELEITESVLLEDYPEISQLLRDLDRLGLRLALDDFGTGYSALGYIKRFPFDVLKIDRSFVQDAVEDPEDAALVRAILAMASALRLEVVGEGVETPAQVEFLRRHGCALGQGYHFSGPITAHRLSERLAGPAFELPGRPNQGPVQGPTHATEKEHRR